MVYWSPRTPPSIRTGNLMTGIDRLKDRVATEQHLSDIPRTYEGESVAGNMRRGPQRPAPSFNNPQEYLAAVAQGQAAGSAWGSPEQIGLRKPSDEERQQITPLAPTFSGPLPSTTGQRIYHPDAKNEAAAVRELAQSEAR